MKRVFSSLLLLMLAGLLLWQAGRQQIALGTRRQELLPGNISVTENMPPLVAFTTVALGGFRGILADILWLRATRLQDEGKYFEIVQLSDWITKLEPRFTPVWGFHAWNMAYNVSVLFDSPGDRWRWVSRGVEMLRDEGIRYNPGSAKLYWELGWMYQHKIGQNLDQAHMFYKMALLYEMRTIFQGRAPNFEDMAAAAHTPAELLERPGVAELADWAGERGLDILTLDTRAPDQLDPEVRDRIRNTEPGQEVLRFLQRRRMVDVYKLDPDFMRAVDEEFGPLDWRMPEAHAIYWARRGVEHADGFIALQLDRMVMQSMAAAFRAGSAFFDVDGTLIPSPNLDILPKVLHAFEVAFEESPENESLRTAHFNYLSEALNILYAYHRIGEAQDLFEEIRERYPSQLTVATMEEFVIQEVAEQMAQMSSRQAHSLVEGMLTQSFLWYAIGAEDRSGGTAQLARLMYQTYDDRFTSEEHEERLGLPPIEDLRRQAFQRLMGVELSDAARARILALPNAETYLAQPEESDEML